MYYRLSRFSQTHRLLRTIGNSVLWRIPDRFKYATGKRWRSVRMPYKLVKPGSVVIQVGAPWDLLKAGRSRAAYFSLLAGPTGKVIVFEPESANVAALKAYADKHRLKNMLVIDKGAWSIPTRLRFLTNKEHPASNLVEEICDQGLEPRKKDGYETSEIEVDTIDNIIDTLDLKHVDLLSITTNGAEGEILKGIHESHSIIRHISTIADADKYPLLTDYGYRKLSHDDRGYTFAKEQNTC